MTAKTFLVALLLLGCLIPASLVAGKEMTTLSIAVLDEAKNRPVPKAAVTVHFIKGRKMLVKKVRGEWNSKTNSRGVVEFPEMPAGKIRVQVIAAGYQTFGDEFEIAGEEHTVTVKLKRPKGEQVSAHEPTELTAPAPETKKPEK